MNPNSIRVKYSLIGLDGEKGAKYDMSVIGLSYWSKVIL